MSNARFLNLKPLFPCTFSGANSPYALINQCFIVIQQALIIFYIQGKISAIASFPANSRCNKTVGENGGSS